MNYISTAQAAQKWGITANRVFKLIRAGRIPRAVKIGSMWMIPEDEEKPVDGRTKAGRAADAAMRAAGSTPEDANGEAPFRYPIFEHRAPESFDPPLSPEELQVKAVAEAFHACRFEEASELLANLPERASNRYCRINALYQACMVDMALGKTVSFANHYEHLFAETRKDFPHNQEMREFVHQIDAALGNEYYYLYSLRVDPTYRYHGSFLPHLATLAALSLTFAYSKPTAAELNAHEVNCKLLEKSRAYTDLQAVHLYLGTGYALAEDFEHAKHHFTSALELAERYELYYNVAMHYCYWSQLMDPALLECTQEIRLHIIQLSAEITRRYLRFMEQTSLNSIYTLLPKGDYALLYYAVQGYTNKEVAKILHVSPSTAGKRYSKIFTAFGVSGKKALVAYYRSFLNGTDLDASHLASEK